MLFGASLWPRFLYTQNQCLLNFQIFALAWKRHTFLVNLTNNACECHPAKNEQLNDAKIDGHPIIFYFRIHRE
jgi:hypothetical protein